MGLDAVVYRNATTLATLYGGRLDVDPETGEASAMIGTSPGLPRDAAVATRQRFGNLAEVAFIRSVIADEFRTPSLRLIGRILSSGSHAGDTISVRDLQDLGEELKILESGGDARLDGFIASVRTLLIAANAEKNPIVFT